MSGVQATPKRNTADALGDEVCELAALNHATTADLVRKVADFDEIEGWAGVGIRSCAHWLTINAGFSLYTGEELVRVGHALRGLACIAEAFAAGQLSLDKVRAITTVATTADAEIWLHLARQASGSQLSRICREYRRATRVDAPGIAEAHLARRGLWSYWDDDGMLHLKAALPPDDGALVLAALEGVAGSRPIAAPGSGDASAADPAEDPSAARRLDALVTICEQTLATHDASTEALATRRIVVHVDLGVLTGDEPDGRCHLEDGPPLSVATALRIGCDAQIVAVTERDGLPIDVGRSRRVVPKRLRRAVQSRDRSCRFPGCGVPGRRTHAHHIQHWAAGGRTELANLVALCGFHHRRFHEGAFRIASNDAGGYAFETADGRAIRPRTESTAPTPGAIPSLRCTVDVRAGIDARTPRAEDGGRLHMDHTIWVTAYACERANAREAPDP